MEEEKNLNSIQRYCLERKRKKEEQEKSEGSMHIIKIPANIFAKIENEGEIFTKMQIAVFGLDPDSY